VTSSRDAGPTGAGSAGGAGDPAGARRPARPRIGVLAVQGDVAEHAVALAQVGATPVEVRLPGQLEGLAGLVIPGGESTAIGKLLVNWGLHAPLQERIRLGFPVWGTCAGAILLASDVKDALPDQPLLGGMDISVRRNAFGRQVQSFETDLPVPALGQEPVHAVFIRAPKIESVGEDVEVLARLDDGTIAAARQGALLATTFHPELTPDTRFHSLFVRMATSGDMRPSPHTQHEPTGARLRAARRKVGSRT
jgi:5'-phosphate synthase pdxT subunit